MFGGGHRTQIHDIFLVLLEIGITLWGTNIAIAGIPPFSPGNTCILNPGPPFLQPASCLVDTGVL